MSSSRHAKSSTSAPAPLAPPREAPFLPPIAEDRQVYGPLEDSTVLQDDDGYCHHAVMTVKLSIVLRMFFSPLRHSRALALAWQM
jgi:hypothetical protein